MAKLTNKAQDILVDDETEGSINEVKSHKKSLKQTSMLKEQNDKVNPRKMSLMFLDCETNLVAFKKTYDYVLGSKIVRTQSYGERTGISAPGRPMSGLEAAKKRFSVQFDHFTSPNRAHFASQNEEDFVDFTKNIVASNVKVEPTSVPNVDTEYTFGRLNHNNIQKIPLNPRFLDHTMVTDITNENHMIMEIDGDSLISHGETIGSNDYAKECCEFTQPPSPKIRSSKEPHLGPLFPPIEKKMFEEDDWVNGEWLNKPHKYGFMEGLKSEEVDIFENPLDQIVGCHNHDAD